MLQSRKAKQIIFIIDIILVIVIAIVTISYAKKLYEISYDKGREIMSADPKGEEIREYEIIVSQDQSLYSVSKDLIEKDIIDSRILFTLENLLFGNKDNVVAGTYSINSHMKAQEIGWALKQNDSLNSAEISFTIPEGYSVHEIAQYLDAQGIVSYDDFIESTRNDVFEYSFLNDIKDKDNYLEGYLFPDTYRIFKNSEPKVIINKMLTRFDEIYTDEIGAKASEMGLTTDDVIKIASVIEKEIRVAEERGLCSAVIHNRMKIDMNLQMCSTVLYVLDKKKEHLLESDLTIESPYNTYINGGLPVGPISNPGADCIIAAVNPANVDYLYFVVNDEEIGSHFFTNNYDEFLNAKAKYNQIY